MNPKRVTAILEVLEFCEDGYLALSRKEKLIKEAFIADFDEIWRGFFTESTQIHRGY
jgi:hypothetical protein